MNLLTLLLLLTSFCATVIGSLMLLVAAFRQSFLWGLGSLLLPFVQLFFLVRHWDAARNGFVTSVIGAMVFMGTIFCMPDRGGQLEDEWKKAFGNTIHSAPANQAEIAELTDQIQIKRDNIAQFEAGLAHVSATLAEQYRQITAERQALNTKDPVAVTKFNEDAAAYHQTNSQAKQLTQNLETAQQELDSLLNQRSKLQAAAKPQKPAQKKVVVYTTSHCGYCVKAKQYLTQKGIAYQEVDVETSSAGQAEFRSMGGQGVPLILVGDQRIEGYDREALEKALQ